MNAKLFFPLISLMLNNCITQASNKLECKTAIYLSTEKREKFSRDEKYRNEIIERLPVVHVTNNISRNAEGQFYMKAGAIYNEPENIPSSARPSMIPIPRATIHFTLGGKVAEHEGGSWTGKKIAFVTTIGTFIDSGKLISIHPHDTYSVGNYHPGKNDIIVAPIDFLKGFSRKIKIGYNDFNGQKIYAYDSNKNNLEEILTQVIEEKEYIALLRDPGAVKYGDKSYWNGLNFTNRSLYEKFLNKGIGYGNHAYTTGEVASRLATIEKIARSVYLDNFSPGGLLGKRQVSFMYDLLNFLYLKIKESNINSKLYETGFIFAPLWIDVLDVLNSMIPENGSFKFSRGFDINKYFNKMNANEAIFAIYKDLNRSEIMKGRMKIFLEDYAIPKDKDDLWSGNYSMENLLDMMTFDDFKIFVKDYYDKHFLKNGLSKEAIIAAYAKRRKAVMGDDWDIVDKASN